MARFLVATVLLVVCLSYASASIQWGEWTLERECYCSGNSGYGTEIWRQNCYGTDCAKSYEEQSRPCNCVAPQVLSPGEIAGIAVGAVVFLILIIIIIIWCCYCGCGDCDDGRGVRRWNSDDSIYRGRVIQAAPPTVVAGPHLHAPIVQQFQPAPVTYAVPAPKPVTFASSVIQQAPVYQQHGFQQQGQVFQQHGAVYAKPQPQQAALTYVM